MEGSISKILKQAFRLAKGYKFFWLLGLLLVWLNLARSSILAYAVIRALDVRPVAVTNFSSPAPEAISFWVGAGGSVFIILAAIFYFRSKGALMAAVSQLRGKGQVDRKLAYDESEPHTIQLLRMGLGFGLLFLLLSAALISPVMYLASNDYSGRALALGALSLLAYLPIFLAIHYLSLFSPMFVVLRRMSLGGSLRSSLDLVLLRWPSLVAFSLAMLATEIIGLALSLALMAISVLPFVLLINVFYDMGGSAASAVQGLAGTVGLMVFFMSQAAVAAFQRIAWTILFFEINKPVKTEDPAEAETLQEVIS
jgi:hypothetical protein